MARASAARAGRMILVEGYTDVLALHQAGLSNAVGIMGTSLTEEQVGILERVVTVLELCLDADRAGQDAMFRAAQLAESRKLELRVVPLPDGTDPADLIEREGADALRALVERSAPFIVFQVERILDRNDFSSAEGRERALAELSPVLAEQPASVRSRTSCDGSRGRLDLSEKRLASMIAESGRPGRVVQATDPRRQGSTRPSATSASSWSCACPCRPTGRGCLFRSTPSCCSRASRSAALPATSPADSLPRSPTCLATTSSSPRPSPTSWRARAAPRLQRRGARARPSAARARTRRARDQARARRRLVGDLRPGSRARADPRADPRGHRAYGARGVTKL